ncbi:hypothetical protein VTO73DRAFT_11215 [Trametes versicolor]
MTPHRSFSGHLPAMLRKLRPMYELSSNWNPPASATDAVLEWPPHNPPLLHAAPFRRAKMAAIPVRVPPPAQRSDVLPALIPQSPYVHSVWTVLHASASAHVPHIQDYQDQQPGSRSTFGANAPVAFALRSLSARNPEPCYLRPRSQQHTPVLRGRNANRKPHSPYGLPEAGWAKPAIAAHPCGPFIVQKGEGLRAVSATFRAAHRSVHPLVLPGKAAEGRRSGAPAEHGGRSPRSTASAPTPTPRLNFGGAPEQGARPDPAASWRASAVMRASGDHTLRNDSPGPGPDGVPMCECGPDALRSGVGARPCSATDMAFPSRKGCAPGRSAKGPGIASMIEASRYDTAGRRGFGGARAHVQPPTCATSLALRLCWFSLWFSLRLALGGQRGWLRRCGGVGGAIVVLTLLRDTVAPDKCTKLGPTQRSQAYRRAQFDMTRRVGTRD